MCQCFQSCNSQQIQHCFRRLPKPVDQFFQHIIILLLGLNPCNALINIQLLEFIADVGIRNKSIHIQINGSLEVFHSMNTLCLLDRLAKHFTVKIIAHCVHMPMLLCSQQISSPSKLQVTHGDLESTSQICKLTDSRKSFFRHLPKHGVPSVHQKRIRRPVGTSDPASQLIKLGKSVLVRIMDDHGIHIGNIQSCLDNSSGNQHINVPIDKIIHNPFQFSLAHLSMGKIHPCVRHQLGNPKGNLINICNPVIDIINLAAPSQLSSDSFPDSLLIILHHISLDRHTIHRRLLQHTHVTDSNHTHMKGSWNGCRSQSQNINILFQLLDFLLVGNAETLFLVNDQKPQILILHILGKNSVSTDHNVYLSFFQILQSFFLLGRCTESAKQIHAHRKLLHSLDKGVVHLLRQNGSWCKVNNLPALLHLFKSCTKSNLCLTISNISAHQTIHDLGALHIPLGILDGVQLILCLLIWEHFLKFLLPHCIRATHIPFFFLTHSVKLHQLFGDIFDSALYLGLRAIPLLGSQLV